MRNQKFPKFPKVRSVLPVEFSKVYAEHYLSNRSGCSSASFLVQHMEKWMHKKIASDIVVPCANPISTLEIGAGTLNQIPYEGKVGPYDIVEPFDWLYKESPYIGRVRSFFKDISEIPMQGSYDRITSIATFEHVLDLPSLVAYCGTILEDNGNVRVAIPSEGTLLWKLGWKLTTGLEFRFKYNLDYEILMRHEHVNTAREIADVLSYFFSDVVVEVFGLTKELSLYQFLVCKNPHLDKCLRYLT